MAELTTKLFFEGLSIEEERELEDIINRSPQKRALFNMITSHDWIKEELKKMYEIDLKAEWKKILKRRPVDKTAKIRRIIRYAAAIIPILFAIELWMNETKRDIKLTNSNTAGVSDPIVNSNKGILQIENGEPILLDTITVNGLLLADGSRLQKNSTGFRFSEAPVKNKARPRYKKIKSLARGRYTVYLPDGTMVDLDANSSIEFPSVFSENERRISVEGVAYFKVARDASRKFITAVHNVEIEVLGTEFTINAYDKKEPIGIQLIKGSLKIKAGNKSARLLPGYQTEIVNGIIKKPYPANVAKATAWQNRSFLFQDDDLKSALREVAHYYNMELCYNGPLPVEKFDAVINRTYLVDSVLTKISTNANVRFTTSRDTIYVWPK